MGKYTLKGSPALDARIDADMARIAEAVQRSRCGRMVRSLVLLGGYGRGEGTPFIRGGAELPFNDYDLVVVTRPLSRRRRGVVQADLRALEQRLSADVGLPVDLCLYAANTLAAAEFSLLNYEMKYGHRVIWGEPDSLSLMPSYPAGAIPLSEGTRLLLNRGKLLLDMRRALAGGAAMGAEDRIRWWKFILKAWLAFGDCTLLIHRDYDISYAVKKARIARYRAAALPDAGGMVEKYLRAVELKEWGDFAPLEGADLAAEFEATRRSFVAFLEWYEQRRVGVGLADPRRYAAALARKGRECGTLKAVLFNLYLLKAGAWRGGPELAAVHPRARLYLALPRLLGDGAFPHELRRLLAAPAAGSAIEDAFYRLRARLS
jgi:hypothetical protein